MSLSKNYILKVRRLLVESYYVLTFDDLASRSFLEEFPLRHCSVYSRTLLHGYFNHICGLADGEEDVVESKPLFQTLH